MDLNRRVVADGAAKGLRWHAQGVARGIGAGTVGGNLDAVVVGLKKKAD